MVVETTTVVWIVAHLSFYYFFVVAAETIVVANNTIKVNKKERGNALFLQNKTKFENFLYFYIKK